MIKIRKLVVLLVATISLAVTGMGYISASAFTTFVMPKGGYGISTTNAEQGRTDFSKSWYKTWTYYYTYPTVTGVTVTGSMTIGFDTFMVNEDYVQNYGTIAGSHYAAVQNSDGTIAYTDTAAVGMGTFKKADVKHTGTPVRYYGLWETET